MGSANFLFLISQPFVCEFLFSPQVTWLNFPVHWLPAQCRQWGGRVGMGALHFKTKGCFSPFSLHI